MKSELTGEGLAKQIEKDRILKMRDRDIRLNNVEAIWERSGGK